MQPLIDWFSTITPQGYLRTLALLTMTLPLPIFLFRLMLVMLSTELRLYVSDSEIFSGLVICGALFLCGLVFWLVARRIEKRSQASS